MSASSQATKRRNIEIKQSRAEKILAPCLALWPSKNMLSEACQKRQGKVLFVCCAWAYKCVCVCVCWLWCVFCFCVCWFLAVAGFVGLCICWFCGFVVFVSCVFVVFVGLWVCWLWFGCSAFVYIAEPRDLWAMSPTR